MKWQLKSFGMYVNGGRSGNSRRAFAQAAGLTSEDLFGDFVDGMSYTPAAPAFAGFSGQRGQAFFDSTHGQQWSCSSCHTRNPLQAGRHAATGKTIAALAPAANAERLSDPAKVEKWFRRNCKDVLKRECTATEKGDVIRYLVSLK